MDLKLQHCMKEEFTKLFGGREFNVSNLSLKHRNIEQEKLII